MKISFDIQIPDAYIRPADVRGNFKAAQSREVRPVFLDLLGSVQSKTPYDSIRNAYSVGEIERGSGIDFSLENSNPIWIFREEDTVPHWAPWGEGSDLAKWSEERGIPAFLVARQIAAEGTKGNFIVRDTWQDTRGDVVDAARRATIAWAQAMGGES